MKLNLILTMPSGFLFLCVSIVYIFHPFTSNPHMKLKKWVRDFTGGSEVENLPANAGDLGSIPDPGSSHMQRSS